ncbi:MAG: ImmA/IrrE family metallo-endopeptidase [Oscillatoria sp. PMC 1068.18]|nr:ImmA/IrrE family metallo-endopeptidase [Oscillatoria sp. PMC 1076.18]MEC4988623.1 ImmA/IrrE family metallo-endopeptidase [Oscillatoria sp. PMC 1068.18]
MSIFKPFRFISKSEIEAKATEILVLMEETPNYAPKLPLDASRVAEFLGLDVVWDRIPADEEGAIAARILPLERLIEINENIPQLQGGFGESTIAHEIGHWVLHIDKNAIERFLRLEKKGVKIKVDPLLCRSAENLAGIEWQAQYFASCLLMPRYQLIESKKGRDLTQWRDLYAMAEELGVTISNLIHRLKDLGWIYLSEGSKNLELGEAISGEKHQVLVS